MLEFSQNKDVFHLKIKEGFMEKVKNFDSNWVSLRIDDENNIEIQISIVDGFHRLRVKEEADLETVDKYLVSLKSMRDFTENALDIKNSSQSFEEKKKGLLALFE